MATAVQDIFREGLMALAQERPQLAVERLGLAAEAAPDDPTVLAFLGAALFAAARADEANSAIARALELAPDAYWPNLKAGELRLRLGDGQVAADRFLAALRASIPGTPDAIAAQAALVLARKEVARSVSHQAVLPRIRWLARRHRPVTPGA